MLYDYRDGVECDAAMENSRIFHGELLDFLHADTGHEFVTCTIETTCNQMEVRLYFEDEANMVLNGRSYATCGGYRQAVYDLMVETLDASEVDYFPFSIAAFEEEPRSNNNNLRHRNLQTTTLDFQLRLFGYVRATTTTSVTTDASDPLLAGGGLDNSEEGDEGFGPICASLNECWWIWLIVALVIFGSIIVAGYMVVRKRIVKFTPVSEEKKKAKEEKKRKKKQKYARYSSARDIMTPHQSAWAMGAAAAQARGEALPLEGKDGLEEESADNTNNTSASDAQEVQAAQVELMGALPETQEMIDEIANAIDVIEGDFEDIEQQ